MAQLFLVRHAQASFGAEDYDNLSPIGHQQSAMLGDYLHARDLDFDLVVTGDMRRHKQTSDGIHKAIKSKEFKVDDNWNEFDFNAIVTAFLMLHPDQKPAATAPRSDWYRVLRSAMIAWSDGALKHYHGESWDDFTQRVKNGAQRILQSEQKRVLVVTSGGAMAIFMMLLFNTSVENAVALNLQIKNTSVNQFFFNENGFQLSTFNHVPHLDLPEYSHLVTYS